MILPDLINLALNECKIKELSEIDICDLYIAPAIVQAGWDQMRQVRREVTLTPGAVLIGDILISSSGSDGRIALVEKDDAYSIVRSAAMIRPYSIWFNKEFLVVLQI